MRVGETVRRPASATPALAQVLLTYLASADFERVPRFLGIDESGRATFSFLSGTVPEDLAHFEDDQLSAAAALLRAFHDAGAGLAPDDQVLCHNDWGPTNTVFRDGLPWGLIDFDTVAPGSRPSDLGYSAFLWLDLGNADYSAAEQARRLRLFCEGYDYPDCGSSDVAGWAVRRQRMLAQRGARNGNLALATWAAQAADWTKAQLATGWP